MKGEKMKNILLIVFLSLICSRISNADLRNDYGHAEITPSEEMLDMYYEEREVEIEETSKISFKKEKFLDEDEKIVMTISPLTIKINKKIVEADSTQIASGIMERAMGPDGIYMSTAYIRKDSVHLFLSVKFPNYGAYAKVPVIEHFWGLGRTKKELSDVYFLILHPPGFASTKKGATISE